ncbi:HAD family hydrolase [Neobacillus sp. OS1-32]|uniref:HAD family hydrolase n=1 Tax=Neobacillus sp. OS1-32 TaxID=3070682 RepID=UPI0027E1D3A9|nr:HAD family hydrolase [Neobacillus sp. OS1-32]WML30164.1 HAD family hydrolase [Neobacillus sp. OS1-32]
MQTFKAIVLDMDGTLLTKDGKIPNKTKNILLKLKDKGIKIFLATGRPISTSLPYHQELDLETPLICLNGAVVYDRLKQKVLSQAPISFELINLVKETVMDNAKAMVCQTFQSNYQLINLIGEQIERYWPVEKAGVMPGNDEPFLKMKIMFNSKSFASYIVNKFTPVLQVSNWGDWFEVTSQSVTKWTSFHSVIKQYGIHVRDVIAFGDGVNDIDLIKNVGIGVAMENALPILKQVSKYSTSSNEDNGIFHFLNNYHVS